MFSVEILKAEEPKPYERQGTVTVEYEGYLYMFGGRVGKRLGLERHKNHKRALMNDLARCRTDLINSGSGKIEDETIVWEMLEYTGDIPSLHNHAGCLWNNLLMIVCGVSENGYENSTYSINLDKLSVEEWVTTGTKPIPRGGLVCEIFDDKMIIQGGSTKLEEEATDPPYFSDVFEFDLVNRHWKELKTKGEKIQPRNWHGSTKLVYKNEPYLVIFGGYFWDPVKYTENYLNDLCFLNLNTLKWKVMKTRIDLVPQRNRCSLVCYKDHFIIQGGNFYTVGDLFLEDAWAIPFSCIDKKEEWKKLVPSNQGVLESSKVLQGMGLQIAHHTMVRPKNADYFLSFASEVSMVRSNDIKLIKYTL